MNKNCTAGLLLLLVLGYFFTGATAQVSSLPPQTPNSHEAYVRALRSAQDSLYQQTLRHYDQYIRLHPDDVRTRIEKCRYIERAFYGEDDEYNPKQEEFDQCLAELGKQFPHNPEVLIYQSESLYGDSAIALMRRIIEMEAKQPERWKAQPIWKVYQGLAQQYSYKEEAEEAIRYGEKACQRNDTLDLSLLLARQYRALSQDKKAIQALVRQLNRPQPSYLLSQKAELLLELKQYDRALKTFNRIQKDTSASVNFASVGKTLEEVGRYQQARQYLLKDTANAWRKTDALKRLYTHDLQYQPGELALKSYTLLRDQGFDTDPFGLNRLKLFVRHPLLPWQWRDLMGLFTIVILVLALLLSPYILILPIHYLGLRRKQQGWAPPPAVFDWGLRHFWYITSFYMLINSVILMWYAPTSFTSFFSDDSTSEKLPTELLANSTLLFFTMLALATFWQVRPGNWASFWGDKWPLRQVVLTGIGSAIGLNIVYRLFRLVFHSWLPTEDGGVDVAEYWSVLVSIKPEIMAINEHYSVYLSFFLVVLLVPVYEEIIFRGIILSSCEKHLSFGWANLIQAVLFALIHQQIANFFFYFGFGLLGGFLRKRSDGLASGLVFHGTNNFFAFFTLIR